MLYYPAIAVIALFTKVKRELWELILSYLFIVVISCSFFIIMPVRMERPILPETGIFNILLQFIYNMDNPVNCFPSQHVALIMSAALSIRRRLREFIPWMVFAILVCFSTVFVKQHYVLDVISGILLAFLSLGLSLIAIKYLFERFVKHPDKKKRASL
jgi:membrane-associated phospholipid phosphatase